MQLSSIFSGEKGGILRKLTTAFGGQLGVFFFGAISQGVIAARILGPEGKGAFSLAVLVAGAVYTIFHGSLGAANAHYSGRNPEWRGGIIGNSFAIAIIGGSILALLFRSLASTVIPHFYPDVDVQLLRIVAFAIPGMLLFEYSNNILLGLNRIKQFSLILVSREFIFLLGMAMLAIFGLLTVRTALLAWVVALAMLAAVSGGLTWTGTKVKLRIDPGKWLKMFKFSFQAHIANLTTYFRLHAEKFILFHFLDLSELGIYTLVVMFLPILYHLPDAAAHVLIPHISGKGDESGNVLTPQMCRVVFFITFLLAIVVALLGKWAIILIPGREFLPAYPALLILLPGTVVSSLGRILAGDLAGRGKPRYAMWISVFILIAKVAVAWVLIPKFGIAGAALAASLTHALNGILFLAAFLYESKASLIDTILIKWTDIACSIRILKSAISK